MGSEMCIRDRPFSAIDRAWLQLRSPVDVDASAAPSTADISRDSRRSRDGAARGRIPRTLSAVNSSLGRGTRGEMCVRGGKEDLDLGTSHNLRWASGGDRRSSRDFDPEISLGTLRARHARASAHWAGAPGGGCFRRAPPEPLEVRAFEGARRFTMGKVRAAPCALFALVCHLVSLASSSRAAPPRVSRCLLYTSPSPRDS